MFSVTAKNIYVPKTLLRDTHGLRKKVFYLLNNWPI